MNNSKNHHRPFLPKHGQKVLSEIPSAFESAYFDGQDEVTKNGFVLGAGVLPFTFSPDGQLYFLLGREHFVPGWRGSDTWSAFEGGTKGKDVDVFQTAAREYMEESLSALHRSCSDNDIASFAQRLREGDYSLRLTLAITPPFDADRAQKLRYHVTFVRYFEWKDCVDAPNKFLHRRDELTHIARKMQWCTQISSQEKHVSTHENEWFNLTNAAFIKRNVFLKDKPSLRLDVAPDFLEKTEVKLFNAFELVDVIHKRKNCHVFRSCFLRTLSVVLQEFQRRLSF